MPSKTATARRWRDLIMAATQLARPLPHGEPNGAHGRQSPSAPVQPAMKRAGCPNHGNSVAVSCIRARPPWTTLANSSTSTKRTFRRVRPLLSDLKRPETQQSTPGVEVSTDGQFVRCEFFAAIVLTDSHLVAGDVDQVCDTSRSRSPLVSNYAQGVV